MKNLIKQLENWAKQDEKKRAVICFIGDFENKPNPSRIGSVIVGHNELLSTLLIHAGDNDEFIHILKKSALELTEEDEEDGEDDDLILDFLSDLTIEICWQDISAVASYSIHRAALYADALA